MGNWYGSLAGELHTLLLVGKLAGGWAVVGFTHRECIDLRCDRYLVALHHFADRFVTDIE
jgi:hypothetical protein